jgi:hypothetical protein
MVSKNNIVQLSKAMWSSGFYREINKQLSQVVDTLFVSPIINSNNKYTLLLLSIS